MPLGGAPLIIARDIAQHCGAAFFLHAGLEHVIMRGAATLLKMIARNMHLGIKLLKPERDRSCAARK